MMRIFRSTALYAIFLLSVGSPLVAMQEMSPEEMRFVQAQHILTERIAEANDALWSRIRSLLMVWMTLGAYDATMSATADAETFIKNHSRSSWAFALLSSMVTLRELIALVGDLRKGIEADEMLKREQRDFVESQQMRRHRSRKAPVIQVQKPVNGDPVQEEVA
jgi:hypothetical protein